MIHDAQRSSENEVTEETGREEVDDPLFNVVERDVEAGRDHAALVQATVELDDDLAGPVVVDDLEFTNVT